MSSVGKMSVPRYLALAIFGAALTFLRVELAFLVFIASIALWLIDSEAASPRALIRSAVRHSHLGAGSALAVVVIRIVTGSVLPDTALAKVQHLALTDQLRTIATGIASSYSFGVGLYVVWIVSAALVFRRLRTLRHVWLACLVTNALLPALLAIAILREQKIQGIRYSLWPLLFMIAWNACVLHKYDATPYRRPKFALVAAAVLLLVTWGFEAPAVARVMAGRSATFLQMRNAHLDRFGATEGMAADVGFVGWFTQARICDMAGLVNGRPFAALSREARDAACSRRKPAFLFVTAPQLNEVRANLDLSTYAVCGQFDFTNVGSADRHYLLVRSPADVSLCSPPHSARGITVFDPNRP